MEDGGLAASPVVRDLGGSPAQLEEEVYALPVLDCHLPCHVGIPFIGQSPSRDRTRGRRDGAGAWDARQSIVAKVNAPPSHGKVMGSGGHSSPMPLLNHPQPSIAEVTEPNLMRLLPQTTACCMCVWDAVSRLKSGRYSDILFANFLKEK